MKWLAGNNKIGMRLTVRDSIGTVTRSLKFGISSKDNVKDFLLQFTSRGTVGDS